MTENHINNFDENNMHLYIPEFAKNGTDGEKIWLTFCYALSQAGGPNTRYEFYTKDMGRVLGTNYAGHELAQMLNKKYGKYIKTTCFNPAASQMWWIDQDFEWVEEIFTAGKTQRTWIHLFNQFWNRTGFNQAIFDRTGEAPSTCFGTWSEIGHGWHSHNVVVKKVSHLLKGRDWMPRYLLPKLSGNHLTKGGRYPKYI